MKKVRVVKKPESAQDGSQDGFIIHEGLSGVRNNPGMYLGEQGEDMAYRCAKEPVDNAYDEMVAGRNKLIEVVFNFDTDLNIVADGAMGIPTDFKTLENGSKESILTAAFSRIHAGGKFNDKAYKTSAGTHGVGVAALNAVSNRLRVWSMYKKKCSHQMWEKGKAVSGKDPIVVKSVDADVAKLLTDDVKKYGTIVAYTLDQTVVSADARRGKALPSKYRHARPNKDQIVSWLRNLTNLNPGLQVRLTFIENKKKETHNFLYTKTIDQLPKDLAEACDVNLVSKPFTFRNDYITCTFAWSDSSTDENLLTYVNASPTLDGGWHVAGFRDALLDTLKPFIKTQTPKGGKRATLKFSSNDLLIGLIGMFDWRMHGAQYTSQVKDKLASRVEKEVYEYLQPEFKKFFDENPRIAQAAIKRAEAACKGREALQNVMRTISDTKAKARGGTLLPQLLIQASGCKPEQRELFVVEGDSAGGCFIGTTPVRLADGQILTFEELAHRTELGEEFEGVSFNIDKKTFERHMFVKPRLTKYVDELVEVEMSDGVVYVCTLDHPWLVDGCRYVAACDLAPGDVLTKYVYPY